MGRQFASRGRWAYAAAALGVLFGLVGPLGPALAHSHHHYAVHRGARSAHRVTRAPRRMAARAIYRNWRGANWGGPTDPLKDAELIEDGRTGRTLYARNADAQRHPASLTKMMTLYMLFDALKKGQVNLNSPVYV